MRFHTMIEQIEKRKGRQLDLNDSRDLFYVANMVDREIKKRDAKLHNIVNVLEGYKTYDPKEQKPIALSKRER